MARLVLLLLAAVCSLWASAQKTYVLAAGINHYLSPEVNDLDACENDVANFTAMMRRQRAEVYTLTGTQATRANIIKAFTTIGTKAKAGDAVIFFFSGHGFPGGFAPVDMHTGDKPWLTALYYDDIKKSFNLCRAKRKMVFANACYSGGIRVPNKKVKRIKKGEEILFFLSSRTNEFSWGRSDIGSVFPYHLIHALEGRADTNNDRIITARELFDYVATNVRQTMENTQHPVMWGKFDNNMEVFRY